MRARHTDLLTPLECAVPRSILISILSARINSLEAALTSHSQLIENTATLSPAECAVTSNSLANPLECALTKNTGGGGAVPLIQELIILHSSLATILKSFLFTLFCTLLHSPKTQLFCFQAIPHSLRKTPGGGGRGATC